MVVPSDSRMYVSDTGPPDVGDLGRPGIHDTISERTELHYWKTAVDCLVCNHSIQHHQSTPSAVCEVPGSVGTSGSMIPTGVRCPASPGQTGNSRALHTHSLAHCTNPPIHQPSSRPKRSIDSKQTSSRSWLRVQQARRRSGAQLKHLPCQPDRPLHVIAAAHRNRSISGGTLGASSIAAQKESDSSGGSP